MLIFHLDIVTCISFPAEKRSQVHCKRYVFLQAPSHAEGGLTAEDKKPNLLTHLCNPPPTVLPAHFKPSSGWILQI